MKPTYFDLAAHDVGRTRKFFERAPGWRFVRFSMSYEDCRKSSTRPAAPLVACGAPKIAYDLMLFTAFQRHEERVGIE